MRGGTLPLWLVPGFPLAVALWLLASGGRPRRYAGHLASLAVGLSAAVSLLLLIWFPSRGTALERLASWVVAGDFRVDLALRLDQLSAVMAATVSVVGFLIHVYSIGYMHGDPRYPRYFAFLNLFVAAMLTLVLADNFLLLYLGWEGVGLCSYLLIGFWFERPAAAAAAKKAFVVTRLGDVGFALGVAAIFAFLGSLSYGEVLEGARELSPFQASLIAFLLFAGAVGKSAQFPLHVWLPDAMEGPTPVSALIHAATMVTAGVYLVVRAHPIFERALAALPVVAAVGAWTAIFAAVQACAQRDMKRVLAYSTVSQLGYMFLGAGVGAYSQAIFHLVTHALFKATLFLGVGSVMHGTGGETDLDRLGGVLPRMRLTALAFGAGWLALAGVPPFSGFVSKDAILASALAEGRGFLWAVGVATALVTAYYSSRLFFLTFLGRPRGSGHPHESPPVMVVPLSLLGAGAVVGGALGWGGRGLLQGFLAPLLGEARAEEIGLPAILPVVAAVVGIFLAWVVYASGRVDWVGLRERLGLLYRAPASRFYFDELYGNLVVLPSKLAAAVLAFGFDLRVVDGAVNGVGSAAVSVSRLVRRVQTGSLRNYALGLAAGFLGLLALFLSRGWSL